MLVSNTLLTTINNQTSSFEIFFENIPNNKDHNLCDIHRKCQLAFIAQLELLSSTSVDQQAKMPFLIPKISRLNPRHYIVFMNNFRTGNTNANSTGLKSVCGECVSFRGLHVLRHA